MSEKEDNTRVSKEKVLDQFGDIDGTVEMTDEKVFVDTKGDVFASNIPDEFEFERSFLYDEEVSFSAKYEDLGEKYRIEEQETEK